MAGSARELRSREERRGMAVREARATAAEGVAAELLAVQRWYGEFRARGARVRVVVRAV